MGLLNIMLDAWRYDRMTSAQRQELQNRRLRRLVSYARENSPYYARAFADVLDSFVLSDLPTANKVDMLRFFDQWVTDPAVTLDIVTDFMRDKENIGRKLQGKYLVNTTSGSTGNPSIVLYDRQMQCVTDAVSALRTFARKEDMRAYVKARGASMGVYADGGFYVSCGSIRRKLLMMPWKKRQIGMVDVRRPTREIVDRLNEFQPALLGGYPTALELLIPEQRNGNLHIQPAIINTGGEYLSPSTRKALSDAFGCYVQTNYACTEGGMIANECTAQHFHINEDWVIVEAVDEHNRPVPYGQQSAKILVTNLANYVQPIIRFEVTDRVRLHNEPCPCGRPGLWLELEGRTDDILTFSSGKRIAPLGLYAILKEIHGIRRFQVVQTEPDLLSLRLTAENREAAFDQAKAALTGYLRSESIAAEVVLSPEPPCADPNSGKFKHIISLQSSGGRL